MYDTMSRPPRPGSLKEVLFVMLQMRRESSRLLETRAVVQAMRDQSDDGKPTQDAYADFRKALMPYLAQEERNEDNRIVAALAMEAARGPLVVKAVETPGAAMKSRLRGIVKSIRSEPRTKLRWRHT